MTYREVMDQQATYYLIDCISRSGGNFCAAARAAGLYRSQFYRLCKRYGIERPVTPHTVLHSRSQRRDPNPAHL